MSSPRPPSAWHITRRSSACASSTSARISSRLKARSRGPWPGRELAPPVVAHLITSAPARTILRTTSRTSARLVTTLCGTSGSPGMQQQSSSARPDGLIASPMPPIGEMIDKDSISRGPVDQPFLDRPLEPGIEPGGVADRGVAGGQGLLQHRGGAQMRCSAARRGASDAPCRSGDWPCGRGSRSGPAGSSSPTRR